MRVSVILLAGLFLAGCGADGQPVQPADEQVSIAPSLNISPAGVSLGTRLRFGKGPFAINLGLGL